MRHESCGFADDSDNSSNGVYIYLLSWRTSVVTASFVPGFVIRRTEGNKLSRTKATFKGSNRRATTVGVKPTSRRRGEHCVNGLSSVHNAEMH